MLQTQDSEAQGSGGAFGERLPALGEHAAPMMTDSPPSSEGVTVELSARRTGMSFQRTRMSADRTLMSVIRTSLSLIGFGFTIFQFFEKLATMQVVKSAHAPRNLGVTLVLIGIGMLVLGIVYHLAFMRGLRKTRAAMAELKLIHGESVFPPSLTLFTAAVLLALGLAVAAGMLFGRGPLE